MTSDIFRNSEQLMTSLDEKPHALFSSQGDKAEKLLKTSLKELNDCFIKQQKRNNNKLQELYVSKFDEEQLWSQMRANDNLVNSKTDDLISSVLANKDQVKLLPGKQGKQARAKAVYEQEEDDDEDMEGDEEAWKAEGDEDEEGEEEEGEDEEMEEEMGEDMGEDDGEDEDDLARNQQEDDTDDEAELKNFERLDEMLENEQINLDEGEEDLEGDDDEEEGGIPENDNYEDEEDEEAERALRKYQLVEGIDEDDDEEEEGKGKKKAALFDDAEVEDDVFEKAREDLLADEDDQVDDRKKDKNSKAEIEALEQRLIDKKTWQLSGEVKGQQRPMNSLLEETLDYNITKKTSTKITPEYSANLEDIIKQRILDEAWDDPIEYAMPKTIKETFNNLEEINFQKSERGLGQIYEDEYKKDVMGVKQALPDDDVKKEIDLLFKKLSYNLDVLSNLNFTPKPSFETAKIIPNVASINLEEKTPLRFSNKNVKAPQEIFNPNKAKFESKEEFSTAENRAARRKVKRNIRTRTKEKKKKALVKNLEFKGQTKYEYNMQKKGQAKLTAETKKKSQKSVDFTKSSQFFDNLEKAKIAKAQPKEETLNTKRKNYML